MNRDDEFTRVYSQLVSKAAKNRPLTDWNSKIQPLRTNDYFKYIDCYQFPCQQELDLSSLIGLVKSISFISSEETVQKQLVDDFEDLHQRFCNQQGFVYLVYSINVHLAELT